MTEERVSSKRLFSGRVVGLRVDEVRILPGGRRSTREVVEHPGAVAVVALTPEGTVPLVRQYRYAVGEELLEVPAGTLEPGEDPAACAVRELAEETGYRAATVRELGSFCTSPGFCSELIRIYLAEVDSDPPEAPNPDDDEQLHTEVLPLDAALDLALSGRLKDAKTVVSLCLAAAAVGRLPGRPGAAAGPGGEPGTRGGGRR